MKRIKDSRGLSYLIVFFVYVVALLVGIHSYSLLKFNFAINLFIADIISTIIVFIFSLIFRNASVYDPYWSVQPIVIVITLSTTVPLCFEKILLIVIIVIWGIRLTVNWAYTFNGLNYQDWRYTMLSEKTGIFYPLINLVGIHLIPTIVVYLAILPVSFVLKSNVSLNIFTILGCFVSIFAIVIQTIADIQMQKYRKNRKGNFIRNGLWKYSRHPNYLGEILMWWGIGVACFSLLVDKMYLLIGAFVNTLLFIFVSLPMAEKRQSKKEGFEEYKKETRLLIPLKK